LNGFSQRYENMPILLPKHAKPKFGDKNVPILLPNRIKSKNRI